MNNTEAEYARYLEASRIAGEVLWWKFEAIKFRLADNTFYTPDFVVMAANQQIELHETKGFWTDDARVKTKVAADQYPIFKFIAAKKLPKKAGGGWLIEEF